MKMSKVFGTTLTLAAVLGFGSMLSGCGDESDTGESIEQTGESVEDAGENAADQAGDAADEAGDEAEDAAN